MAGVQKTRGGFVTLFAVAALLVGSFMMLGGVAGAHTPDGWSSTDLLQGNENQVVAGTLDPHAAAEEILKGLKAR